MQVIRFIEDGNPERVDALEALPESGFAWLDFVREDAPDWKAEVVRLTGIDVHYAHVRDSLNPAHPSYFDAAGDYDMIIFRGLASSGEDVFGTQPTALFVFPQLLVTVRSRESTSVGKVTQRLFERGVRIPQRSAGLMLLVLSAMVDRFMALREPLTDQLEEWQDALLDPNNPFDDWMSLMRHKNRLRRLERMCDAQADALTAWRDDPAREMDDSLRVRTNDLMEHIQRVISHTQHLEAQLESLVQIHFAAVAHRTNEIMRVLTVLTAVFLPLGLVAGIFGMNFENMPELKFRYAYYVTLGAMILVGGGMLVYFRRKRWF